MKSTDLALPRWKFLAPLPLARAGSAVGVIDGRLIVAGGTYWSEGRKLWSDRVDAFDASANRWEPVAPLPAPHADSAYVTYHNALYVLGGGSQGQPATTAWRYAGGQWTEQPALALPAPRRSLQFAVWQDAIYLIGGFSGDHVSSASSTVWSGRPGQPWKTGAPIPGPARFNPAVAAIPAGIVVAGGATWENGHLRNLADILLYRPDRDTWTTLGAYPAPTRAGFAFTHGDRVLLLGGYTDQFLDQVLELDPASGRVVVVGQMPHPLADTRFARIGGSLLCVTGEAGDKIRAPWTMAVELP